LCLGVGEGGTTPNQLTSWNGNGYTFAGKRCSRKARFDYSSEKSVGWREGI